MTSQNLILGIALVLTVLGMAGLAPALIDAFRSRRLRSNLARLDLEGEAAVEDVDAGHASEESEPLQQRIQAIVPQTKIEAAPEAYVAQPMPAVRAAAVIVDAAGPERAERSVTALPAAAVTVDANEPETLQRLARAAVLEVTTEDSAEEDAEPEEAAPPPELPRSDEEDDDDDLLAMFRDTKAKASTPEVLTEAIEKVAARDLLAEAKELRDLLRRAA